MSALFDAKPAGYFRSKWVAGLLGLFVGSLGLHQLFLGRKFWWVYPVLFLPLIGTAMRAEEWYREPTFFLAALGTLVALFNTIRIGLTPAEKWDPHFNAGVTQTTRGGATAVIIAVVALMAGATLAMAVMAIALEGFFLSQQP
jgi:hypothetical protein